MMHAARVLAAQALSRRAVLLGAGAWGLVRVAHAQEATLPVAGSLPQQLAGALRQGNPLVVMVSLHGCPFCKLVRESYLAPLVREQNLPVVQVDMQSRQALTDLRGVVTTHDAQVQAWGVRIAPTVLFFGRGGNEVVKRLVGGMLSDFYGAYLDQRLADARKTLT